MFNHVDIDLPKLERETIDGVRYYSVPDEDELIKLVSITSITSHFNKEVFSMFQCHLYSSDKTIGLNRYHVISNNEP